MRDYAGLCQGYPVLLIIVACGTRNHFLRRPFGFGPLLLAERKLSSEVLRFGVAAIAPLYPNEVAAQLESLVRHGHQPVMALAFVEIEGFSQCGAER